MQSEKQLGCTGFHGIKNSVDVRVTYKTKKLLNYQTYHFKTLSIY